MNSQNAAAPCAGQDKQVKRVKIVEIDEIEEKKGAIFLKTFETVNENFQRIFSMLTSKGIAFLELENPKKPFEGGMTLKVKLTSSKYMENK